MFAVTVSLYDFVLWYLICLESVYLSREVCVAGRGMDQRYGNAPFGGEA